MWRAAKNEEHEDSNSADWKAGRKQNKDEIGREGGGQQSQQGSVVGGKESKPNCKFFVRGLCSMGESCRYLHNEDEVSWPIKMSSKYQQTVSWRYSSMNGEYDVSDIRKTVVQQRQDSGKDSENRCQVPR